MHTPNFHNYLIAPEAENRIVRLFRHFNVHYHYYDFLPSSMNSDLLPYGPAPPIAIYSDIATGFTACQAHAKANSYAFKHSDSK